MEELKQIERLIDTMEEKEKSAFDMVCAVNETWQAIEKIFSSLSDTEYKTHESEIDTTINLLSHIDGNESEKQYRFARAIEYLKKAKYELLYIDDMNIA